MVLIKLVLDKIGLNLEALWPKTCFAAGENRRRQETTLKRFPAFFWVDQKGISFLGSAQLSLLKSDKR